MRQPVQVLIHPYTIVAGRVYYLLLHRLASRTGTWQGMTGGVEDDEEVLTAAQRELFEETGFTAGQIRQVQFSYSYPLADQFKYLYAEGVTIIHEYIFVAPAGEQFAPVIDPREHDEWAWFGYEQALAQLVWPGNIEALRHCQALILGSTLPT